MCLLLVTLAFISCASGAKILLALNQLGSQMIMLHTVGQELASRGHKVDLLCILHANKNSLD